VNDLNDSSPGEQRTARRRRRATFFLAAWTLFALCAVWWLIQRGTALDVGKPLRIDAGNSSQSTAGQQIHTWLELADLNFRGAYAWLLLAPYIILLALRFPLERGRLFLSAPVHLAACVLFVVLSTQLLNRIEPDSVSVLVVSTHREGGPIPWPVVSNNLPPGPDRAWTNLVTNTSTYFSSSGDFTTTTVVTPPGAEGVARRMPLPTNAVLGSGIGMLGDRLEIREIVGSETNLGPGGAPQAKGMFAWSSSRQDGRRPFSLLLDILAYSSFVGAAHAVLFYRRYREREARAILVESHLATARLHALQAQLHPHFLFNALNAVATLIRHDADAALETLTSFSELLRLALGQSEKQQVPLREDLRFLERYVEIQRVRLGDRFRFEQDVDPAALDCLVPALLLQPLVENSLRHGLEPISRPGLVRLTVHRIGERLLLDVDDDGAGFAAAPDSTKSGIGLSNLRVRLKMLYGDNQRLEIGPRPSGGVTVHIEIPVRTDTPTAAATPTASS
jgi:hypothetical protein